jgi:fatty acid-binding protein DegV
MPGSSQPSVGDFLAVYEPLLDDGADILSIHLSAGISGTFTAAEQACDQLVERGIGPGAAARAHGLVRGRHARVPAPRRPRRRRPGLARLGAEDQADPLIGAHVGPGLLGVAGMQRALLYPRG